MSDSLLVLSNEWLPTAYVVHLDISPLKPNFQGQMTIDLSRNAKFDSQTQTNVVTLNSSEIIIRNAVFKSGELVSDKIAARYDRTLQTVAFDIPSDFVSNEQNLQLCLTYMGKVNQTKTYQDPTRGIFKTNYLDSVSGKSSNYIIATHTQPTYARSIFPLIDELTSKVPITLSITTESRFKCISNTPLLESTPIGETQKLFKFKKSPPMAASVFAFVLGDLDFVEKEVTLQENRTIPLRFYVPIGELSSAAYGLDITSKVLPRIEEMLKYPYPLDKLDIAALPFLSDGAMENWGLIALKQEQILVPEYAFKNASFTKQVREVIAHELVHQWVGNLVTFESWDYLWFNEAFATFLALHVLEDLKLDPFDRSIWTRQFADFEDIMDTDSFEDTGIVISKNYGKKVSSTADAFDANSYTKGIYLIKQLGNVLENNKADNSFDIFLKGISLFLIEYAYKSAKLQDLWKILHKLCSEDILGLMHSWTNLPGFPVLSVKANEANNKIIIEQHRCLYNFTAEELKLEDNPYSVPLNVRLTNDDSKIVRLVLNDRKIELDIKPEDFLILNANVTGYYKCQYTLPIIENIARSIKQNRLSEIELNYLIETLGKQISQEISKEDDILGLLTVIQALSDKNWKIIWSVLRSAMAYLEAVNRALYLYKGDEKTFKRFTTFVDEVVNDIFKKIPWDKKYDIPRYGESEVIAKSSLLMLGMKNKDCQAVAKKYFRLLTQGPRKSLPKELLPVTFSLAAYSASQKEYKQILALVKSAGVTINNTNASGPEIQTAAVGSLGFAQKDDLISKTLNFVMTNIDSKLIELALLGLQFNSEPRIKSQLWNWFKLHYDDWTLKSLREGSDYAAQLSNTMKNVTKIVFTNMNTEDEIKMKEEFIREKTASLPKHGLGLVVESHELENEGNVRIAEFAPTIDSWLLKH